MRGVSWTGVQVPREIAVQRWWEKWVGFEGNHSGARARMCSAPALVTPWLPTCLRRGRGSPYLQFLNNSICYLTLDLKLQ